MCARLALALVGSLSMLACSTSPSDTADAASTPDAAPMLDAYRAPSPMITIPDGTIVGTQGMGFRAFLGIPYAAPPTGPLRFRPPQPVTPWSTPLVATRRPHACPQNLEGIAYGQEDCLYLNVHTPDPMPTHAPVMIWIHGGAFVLGEGVQADGGTYGDLLARDHGVIVVSMNYRLGQLGFLAHPALDAESADHVSGNYGFLDQVAAIQWVHDHIAAFGGDPGNVTIFGESAGGMAVNRLMISPAARGLFAKAIVQSGAGRERVATLAAAEKQGEGFARSRGVDAKSSAELRAIPADKIIAAGDPSTFEGGGPVLEPHTFPMPVAEAPSFPQRPRHWTTR